MQTHTQINTRQHPYHHLGLMAGEKKQWGVGNLQGQTY